MTKHNCSPKPDLIIPSIKCIGVTDSKRYFDLVWIDGSRLLVDYCPFCGEKANTKDGDESR